MRGSAGWCWGKPKLTSTLYACASSYSSIPNTFNPANRLFDIYCFRTISAQIVPLRMLFDRGYRQLHPQHCCNTISWSNHEAEAGVPDVKSEIGSWSPAVHLPIQMEETEYLLLAISDVLLDMKVPRNWLSVYSVRQRTQSVRYCEWFCVWKVIVRKTVNQASLLQRWCSRWKCNGIMLPVSFIVTPIMSVGNNAQKGQQPSVLLPNKTG